MRYVEPGGLPQYFSGNYNENIVSIPYFSLSLRFTFLLASHVRQGFLTQLMHSYPLH
jgi:hypothetical protein